jgi:DNA ligase-associated metallophosphoesterase
MDFRFRGIEGLDTAHDMVPFSFAGETFFASPEGALHWPAENALLVADLHLEKASWYARLGQLLPPYDSHATLTALARLVEESKVRRLYCLGDSFHDQFGCDRLPADARAALLDLTGRLEWTWILGNHDPGFADHCGGRLVEEAEVRGILLRHEAVRGDSRPEISGHFHPKYRVSLKGRHVSRRCIVASDSKLILPAFGTLTGGLDASHPEILKQVGTGAAALVPLQDRLLRFPIAA